MTITKESAFFKNLIDHFTNIKVTKAENNIEFVIIDRMDGKGILSIFQVEEFTAGGAAAKFHTDLQVYDGGWVTVFADFLTPVDVSAAGSLQQPYNSSASLAIGPHRVTRLNSYYTTGTGSNSGFRLLGRLVATANLPVDFTIKITALTAETIA